MQHSVQLNSADQVACSEAIRKGSLSFSFASVLLSLEHRHAVHALYSWCRWCDNTIDDLPKEADIAEKIAAVTTLRTETELALRNSYSGSHYVFRSLQAMNTRYKIPPVYFHDLIDGMEMDIRKHRYADLKELELYCYRVAGVVGLMFSHIVGVRDENALEHAVALGIAMQMTNIARDVADDERMGRVYLPESWLREEESTWSVVTRLLAEADRHYQLGAEGLRYLPWKAALAAGAALNIYSEIGKKILRRGPAALSERTIVSNNRKIILIFKTFMQAVRQIPYRMVNPYRRCAIEKTWRYQ